MRRFFANTSALSENQVSCSSSCLTLTPVRNTHALPRKNRCIHRKISRQSSRENEMPQHFGTSLSINPCRFRRRTNITKAAGIRAFHGVAVLYPDRGCAFSRDTNSGTCDIGSPANLAIPPVWRMTTAFACDEKSPSRCCAQRCEIHHQRVLVEA